MNRLFENNGVLKIISVIFAIILWMYAIRDLNPDISRPIANIPVEIVKEEVLRSKQLTLADEPSDRQSIRIRGKTMDVGRVDVENIKMILDLSQIDKPGEHNILLTVEGLPPGVTVERQPTIQVTVDNLVSKEVPVEIIVSGTPAEGYQAHTPVMNPDTVRVWGAESLLDRITQGIVEIDIDNAQETIDQSLRVELLDEEGQVIQSRFIRLEQGYVIVSVPIYMEGSLPVELNITGEPAQGYEIVGIEITPNQIAVSGRPEVIKGLDAISTEMLDIDGATQDVAKSLKLQIYEGIYIDPDQPGTVDVIVRIREITDEQQFEITEVDTVNLPEGLIAELYFEPIVVYLSGRQSAIGALDATNIRVYVDLTEIVSGEFQIPLKVELPNGIDVLAIEPQEITVVVLEADETNVIDNNDEADNGEETNEIE